MAHSRRFDTISHFVRNGVNLKVSCWCGHVGILHSERLRRWAFCWHWNENLEACQHKLYCRKCRGQPKGIGPTTEPPTDPEWMQHEYQWNALMKLLAARRR